MAARYPEVLCSRVAPRPPPASAWSCSLLAVRYPPPRPRPPDRSRRCRPTVPRPRAPSSSTMAKAPALHGMWRACVRVGSGMESAELLGDRAVGHRRAMQRDQRLHGMRRQLLGKTRSPPRPPRGPPRHPARRARPGDDAPGQRWPPRAPRPSPRRRPRVSTSRNEVSPRKPGAKGLRSAPRQRGRVHGPRT